MPTARAQCWGSARRSSRSARGWRCARNQESRRSGSASRFEALERYIAATLDAPGRIHLKLLNPLGVGASLADKHLTFARDRLALLKEDFATLDEVDRQLTVYREDLMRDFDFRMADIDRILLEMERRGQDYFDDTMRIGRVMDLLNRSRVQQGFEQQVVADAPQQIERKVGELVDWLVSQDLQAVAGRDRRTCRSAGGNTAAGSSARRTPAARGSTTIEAA